MSRASAELAKELGVAEDEAWNALARYKFMQFGYWAAIWVHLNRIGGFKRPNPWSALVKLARAQRDVVPAPVASPLFDSEAA